MKTTKIMNRIGGAILGLVMLTAIGFTFGTTAQAQYRNDTYSQDQRRIWEREQARRAREARLEHERLDREAQRRDGDWDRNGTYNDRNRNRRGRNGDGYGNYGGSANFRQTALNAGYNEGIKEGRKDRRNNETYEFRDESAFQKATKDYNSRNGDRTAHMRYFREAFENGYGDGYRGY